MSSNGPAGKTTGPKSGGPAFDWEVFSALMRPPGQGVPTFSAGSGRAFELKQAYSAAIHVAAASGAVVSGATGSKSILPDEKEIQAAWKRDFEKLAHSKVAIIGVPLDTGAGIQRGAASGPSGLRAELLKDAEFLKLIRGDAVVDLGDVWVNPHLLHDEMLNAAQIRASQIEMYPTLADSIRHALPVSGLSQLEYIASALLRLHPHLKFMVLGGDHSVAYPLSQALIAHHKNAAGVSELGIVQPDAHTDLLPSRLGVKYCFGTWSYHANELLGREGKLVQVGIRTSAQNKAHWESSLQVKQFWAHEILAQPFEQTIQEIIGHLKRAGVTKLYFSNDIDGTDIEEASATGTPEAGGPPREFFVTLMRELAIEFEWVGSDLMEFAPVLARGDKSFQATMRTARTYVLESLRALLS